MHLNCCIHWIGRLYISICEYESTQNHISKRGSPYLRRAIFQAAFVASNNDPVFLAYYKKKAFRRKTS